MDDSMNVAKMKPWGMLSSFGLRAGVHRNTNVYMEPSKSDWIAPRRAIFSSDPPSSRPATATLEDGREPASTRSNRGVIL